MLSIWMNSNETAGKTEVTGQEPLPLDTRKVRMGPVRTEADPDCSGSVWGFEPDRLSEESTQSRTELENP